MECSVILKQTLFDMNYLLVKSTQDLTATERAEAISKELYSISRPDTIKEESDVSLYLFGVIEHPTTSEAAISVDLDYVITVHQDNDLNNLIALFANLSAEESNNLEAYIKTHSSFVFNNILPSDAILKTQEEMETDGWFPNDEI